MENEVYQELYGDAVPFVQVRGLTDGDNEMVQVINSDGATEVYIAKGADLKYFVKAICGMDYKHITDFAPTKELLDKWRKEEVNWEQYTDIYIGLLKNRDIIKKYGIKVFDNSCFLCSEETPEQCHRRLLVEFLKEHSTEEILIKHIV